MKKELWIGSALALFFVALTIFLAGRYGGLTQTLNSGNAVNGSGSGAVSNTSPVSLSAEEVAKHNSAPDCWMIVDKKVYAISSYLNQHPGGRDVIIPFCGRDGTAAFLTKGGRGSHSSFASQLLSSFLLGALNSSISADQVQKVQSNAVFNINNPGGESERED